LDEALKSQKYIRNLLEDKVFKIIAWVKKSKQEVKMAQACMCKSSTIYRNIEEEDLSARVIFTILASQIFLSNNYKFDLDVVAPIDKRR
jgi:hypothetical protein